MIRFNLDTSKTQKFKTTQQPNTKEKKTLKKKKEE